MSIINVTILERVTVHTETVESSWCCFLLWYSLGKDKKGKMLSTTPGWFNLTLDTSRYGVMQKAIFKQNLDFFSFIPVPLQDAFVAFHVDKVLVSKYLKPLQIGELAPDQPTIEPTKNVSLSSQIRSKETKGKYSEHNLFFSTSIAPGAMGSKFLTFLGGLLLKDNEYESKFTLCGWEWDSWRWIFLITSIYLNIRVITSSSPCFEEELTERKRNSLRE